MFNLLSWINKVIDNVLSVKLTLFEDFRLRILPITLKSIYFLSNCFNIANVKINSRWVHTDSLACKSFLYL
jgi:hypothetical protein